MNHRPGTPEALTPAQSRLLRRVCKRGTGYPLEGEDQTTATELIRLGFVTLTVRGLAKPTREGIRQVELEAQHQADQAGQGDQADLPDLPIGSRVLYRPIAGGEEVFYAVTRSAVWRSPNGPMVKFADLPGGYLVSPDHLVEVCAQDAAPARSMEGAARSRALILAELERGRPKTITQLADETGLSKTTIRLYLPEVADDTGRRGGLGETLWRAKSQPTIAPHAPRETPTTAPVEAAAAPIGRSEVRDVRSPEDRTAPLRSPEDRAVEWDEPEVAAAAALLCFVEADSRKGLGRRIRDLRLAQHWSQDALARRLNVSQTMISACERGILRLETIQDVLGRLLRLAEGRVDLRREVRALLVDPPATPPPPPPTTFVGTSTLIANETPPAAAALDEALGELATSWVEEAAARRSVAQLRAGLGEAVEAARALRERLDALEAHLVQLASSVALVEPTAGEE